MHVITRSGIKEPIKFDKITERIESLCFELNMDFIDPILISQKVIEGIFDGITTQRLDQLAAETAAYLGPQHPDYALLAGRIAVSNLHKETNPKYYSLIKKFKEMTNCPVLINTSFNVRGEPIVNTPSDAFNCFMGTEMDKLVIGNCFLDKKKQNKNFKKDYKNQFELD